MAYKCTFNEFKKIILNSLINQGLLYCQNCNHLSINKVLDPNFIYSNYLQTSNSSGGCNVAFKKIFLIFLKRKIA